MQLLDIQGFSYKERDDVLPCLGTALADCGGWILCRKAVSPSAVELQLEIQLRGVLDLYVGIVSSGLELTRRGHLTLTDLCNCRKNLTDPTELSQVVTVRIEISFLEDVPYQPLLIASRIPA